MALCEPLTIAEASELREALVKAYPTAKQSGKRMITRVILKLSQMIWEANEAEKGTEDA